MKIPLHTRFVWVQIDARHYWRNAFRCVRRFFRSY